VTNFAYFRHFKGKIKIGRLRPTFRNSEFHYTPFGSCISSRGFSSAAYRFGFNNQEKDGELGDSYAFEYRIHYARLGRFLSVDPLFKKFEAIVNYGFASNSPIVFFEIKGLKPGDLYTSADEAAKAWGKQYNDNSIRDGKEYASEIYQIKKGNKIYFTYTKPNLGGNASATTSKAPEGSVVVADIHSHGKYEAAYENNKFSSTDKSDNDKKKINGYLTTPNGSFQKYDVKTKTVSVLSTDLPSDINDPDRKNKISTAETEVTTPSTKPAAKPQPKAPLPPYIPDNVRYQRDNTVIVKVIPIKK